MSKIDWAKPLRTKRDHIPIIAIGHVRDDGTRWVDLAHGWGGMAVADDGVANAGVGGIAGLGDYAVENA